MIYIKILKFLNKIIDHKNYSKNDENINNKIILSNSDNKNSKF